jgi:hypothetical protein
MKNRVVINVERVGSVGDRGDFIAVVADRNDEDIKVTLLADPKLLQFEPHEIVKEIADRDSEVADLIQNAIENGTEVRVNEKAAMDNMAYRQLAGPILSGPTP